MARATAWLKKGVKAVLRRPADALLASATRRAPGASPEKLTANTVIDTPQIAAKILAYAGDERTYVVPRVRRNAQSASDALPVPPPELWEGYATNVDAYVTDGANQVAEMRRLMADSGFPLQPGYRVLDFGCASGRMIRHLADLAAAGEVWGVDINEKHIYWCQQHLTPPFRFVNTATFPHLPFEDRTFDFIYAGSVFTHISEMADAWLLELRRILRPGGRMFLSVHDRHLIDVLLTQFPDGWLTKVIRHFDAHARWLDTDFAVASVSTSPYAQIFYDIDYLRERWSAFLNVVAVHQQGHGVHTVVVLEKPARA